MFEYAGHPDAERVLMLMGSGAETAKRNGRGSGPARGEGRRGAGAALSAVFRHRRCWTALPPTVRTRRRA